MWTHVGSVSRFSGPVPAVHQLGVGTRYRKHEVIIEVTANEWEDTRTLGRYRVMFSVSVGSLLASLELDVNPAKSAMKCQAGRLGGRLVGEILAEHLERMVKKADDLVILEAAEEAAEVKKQKKGQQVKSKENDTANKKKPNIVNILNENTSTLNKTEEQTNTPGLKIPECPVCLTEMGSEARIYQCGSGHLVCADCFPKLKQCPSKCGKKLMGRAFGMEQHLRDQPIL